MPKIDAIKFSSYTALYLFIYFLSLLTYITSNLLSIIFFQYTAHDFLLLGQTCLTCLLIAGALCLLKFLVKWAHLALKVGQLERWRNEMLVGLGGVALCGTVPRILIYFVEIEAWTVYFSLIVFTTTAILFGVFFLDRRSKKGCKFIYSMHDKTSWALIIAHTVILAVTVILSLDLQAWERSTIVILCHVTFAVMCGSSTVELVKIFRGEFRILDSGEVAEEEKEDAPKVKKINVIVHKSETDPQMTEPKITMFNYSI